MIFDVLVVVVFVLIGRRNHDESIDVAGFVHTAAPFVLALIISWTGSRAWTNPLSLVTGVAVWIGTLIGGMALRHFVFDDGTAMAFVIVATIFLGTGFSAWRSVARLRANS